MSKRKILIVDDEPDLREILVDEFEFAGFEVFQAEGGKLGFTRYLEKKPSAIISDIRMPEGDGFTLAKEIKKVDPTGVKVYLVTGYADISTMDAFQMGVDGFFAKPFKLEEIRDSLERAMGPLEQRFQKHPEDPPVSAEIVLQVADWKKEISCHAIPMGRGGLFIAAEKMKPLPRLLRNESIVSLSCQGTPLAVCKVRWSQSEAEGQASSYGLEFVSMESVFLEFYKSQKDILNKATYIPATVVL